MNGTHGPFNLVQELTCRLRQGPLKKNGVLERELNLVVWWFYFWTLSPSDWRLGAGSIHEDCMKKGSYV